MNLPKSNKSKFKVIILLSAKTKWSEVRKNFLVKEKIMEFLVIQARRKMEEGFQCLYKKQSPLMQFFKLRQMIKKVVQKRFSDNIPVSKIHFQNKPCVCAKKRD